MQTVLIFIAAVAAVLLMLYLLDPARFMEIKKRIFAAAAVTIAAIVAIANDLFSTLT